MNTQRKVLSRSKKLMHDVGSAKLPPQDTELEAIVLGALMLEKTALDKVISFLKPEHFYDPNHALVFKAIEELCNRSGPVDIKTVANKMKEHATLDYVGGYVFISELTARVSSAANIESHARMLIEHSIRRNLISVATSILSDAYDPSVDVIELVEDTEKQIFVLNQTNGNNEYADGVQVAAETMKELAERKNNKKGINGVPSGLPALDRMTHGFQKGHLIIIGARPGMGKTAFVLSMIRHVIVNEGIPTAMFSLEMTSVELMRRLFSIDTEIPADTLKGGNINDFEWNMLLRSKVASRNLIIDDTPGLGIYHLRNKLRRMKERHNIQFVVIDYLQLMRLDGASHNFNREQSLGEISRTLKALAKECQLPIIALSQLSRAVETRGGDKRPQLSDLRETGSFEQDADLVAFLFRAEYYNITVDEYGQSTKGMGELIIPKHRDGSTGTVKLKFIDRFTKFIDLEDMERTHHSWQNPSLEIGDAGDNQIDRPF